MQPEAAIHRKLVLHPAWLVFAALALAVPMSVLLLRPAVRSELPVLAELPQFSLVDEQGRKFGRDEMLGKVWIADFVFTSCADACPRLQAKMRRIQDRLLPPEQGGNMGLLSISVDPERDTPEKLREYGQLFGARPALWKHLTGPQREVERTVVKGFRIAMAKMPAPIKDNEIRAEAFDIMHGERLVLVDRQGRIRGYYDADDEDRLLRDARSLTAGGRG
ncbi:MAG TPA: SCO family protein [Myxococcales bacterium]|jgi:protein SCO1/2